MINYLLLELCCRREDDPFFVGRGHIFNFKTCVELALLHTKSPISMMNTVFEQFIKAPSPGLPWHPPPTFKRPCIREAPTHLALIAVTQNTLQEWNLKQSLPESLDSGLSLDKPSITISKSGPAQASRMCTELCGQLPAFPRTSAGQGEGTVMWTAGIMVWKSQAATDHTSEMVK